MDPSLDLGLGSEPKDGSRCRHFVSWYDAFAFSKFAFWDDCASSLPTEAEHEFATRAPWLGQPPDEIEYCNWAYETHQFQTLDGPSINQDDLYSEYLSLGPEYENRCGLRRMTGGAWQWDGILVSPILQAGDWRDAIRIPVSARGRWLF